MQNNQYLHIMRQNEGKEKSNLSPSSKDTPTEEGELTTEHDKDLRLMWENWHLQITRQNEGSERNILSPSSKDDGRNCKRQVVNLRPEPWRKKPGGDKNGNHNLGIIANVVIGVILGIMTYNFKPSHTPQSVFSWGLTNKNHSTHQISLVEYKQVFSQI